MKKKRIGVYIFLTVMAVMFAAPMLFTLMSSLKTKVEIFSAPFALPRTPMWSNYLEAWHGARMSRYFLNSIMQSGITVIALGILSSMAAFVLSRFRLRISKSVMLFFLIGMMVPMHTVLVPISYMIGKLSLSDNIPALILVYVAFGLPFSILVLTNFMRGVNRSLEEAALVDGASYV